jgi:hypothetical protein
LQKTANMRDKRFIAENRGGPLKKEQHYQIITWACDCAEHVVHLIREPLDERLSHALKVVQEWKSGNASVGEAMKASTAAHAVARESSGPTARAVARSIGQAVATAHMADHALGAAWYAVKAVNLAGQSTDAERRWQDEHLPPEIKDLILTARKSRKI